MSAAEIFFDSNVLLHLLSADSRKADHAEELLFAGGTISVQVLNEFAAVASRKLKMSWSEIRIALAPVRTLCRVVPLSIDVHERALLLSERHGFAFYDASIDRFLRAALRLKHALLRNHAARADRRSPTDDPQSVRDGGRHRPILPVARRSASRDACF